MVRNQVIVSTEITRYPIGTTFEDCTSTATETLPLGYKFRGNHIHVSPGFQGDGVFNFPCWSTASDVTRALLDITEVVGNHVRFQGPKPKFKTVDDNGGIPDVIPTFWHTLLGRLLAPLFRKPLICGQTCGCTQSTGCLSRWLAPSTAGWRDRRECRTGR